MFFNNGAFLSEDFTASGHSKYTVTGVDNNDPNWLDKAANKVNAASGSDYVKLRTGLLTVDQLNGFLNCIPFEFSYVDDNNQFLAFNHNGKKYKRMTERDISQLGEGLENCFPSSSINGVKALIHDLRTGKHKILQTPVPTEGFDFVVHYFEALHDENQNYVGTVEWTGDIWQFIQYYLKTNDMCISQKVDAVSGASAERAEMQHTQVYASTGASRITDLGDYKKENLKIIGETKYTIPSLDPQDPNWLTKAAKITKAAQGDDYVRLESGLLTVNQIEYLLKAIKADFNFVDDNNQFLAYGDNNDLKTTMTVRTTSQLGEALADCFPHEVPDSVKVIVHALRDKKINQVKIPVPKDSYNFPVHYFLPVTDQDNNYLGISEWGIDIWPFVQYFLKVTGQHLTKSADVTSSASEKMAADRATKINLDSKTDVNTSASQHN